MKIHLMVVALLAAGAFAAPLHAQDTGLNKVAKDVSSTVKKAGRDTKAEVHRDASKTHAALTKTGNEVKTKTGNATGIHKVGGTVGHAAKAVSSTSKTAGREVKHSVKQVGSQTHDSLTKAGEAAKAKAKNP